MYECVCSISYDDDAIDDAILSERTYNQSYTSQVLHINIWKKVLTKAIWADKNGLVSGRLACTSSKTEI